ncbi:aspartate kinase [Rhodohalobacter barkolensis]|uniref:Aspartokinase n=1 Tax=Rhodohalobacter barkolensis TaxID=2053187 RepID=A0A2N0VGA4_9BACT|nr:aspartate kinase [Rhodohalobacter barkolensis]PKD43226.1 hypothetical protein CWD77_11470 [Rhodohalobacter barkolensis]
MRVLKFGGTSLADEVAIKKVLSIIKNRIKDEHIIVVTSALNGVTDQLYELNKLCSSNNAQYQDLLEALKERHYKIIDNLLKNIEHERATRQVKNTFIELENALSVKAYSPKDFKKKQDYVVGFGEKLSTQIITECLISLKINALYTDSSRLIKTDDNYGSAAIIENLTYKNIKQYYRENRNAVIIATGFISSTVDGIPTTLGRGGSDYTASLFGAAIQANAIEIWTDVDGLMTADPKKVESASLITRVSYESAKNMSFFGAKVIYPPTIEPAMRYDIPIYIKNTFRPSNPGTIIESNSNINYRKQYCISSFSNISLITFQSKDISQIENSMLKNIFFNDKLGITFVTHTKTNTDIKFAFSSRHQSLTKSKIDKLIRTDLSKIITKYVYHQNLSMVTIVHDNASALFHKTIVNYLSKTPKNMLESVMYDNNSKSLSIFSDKKHELQILNSTHHLVSSLPENIINSSIKNLYKNTIST